MIKNESSPAVYGLFFDDVVSEYLIGIYFLEGEAEAARQAYVDQRVLEYDPIHKDQVRVNYQEATIIRRLAVGQPASLRFAI